MSQAAERLFTADIADSDGLDIISAFRNENRLHLADAADEKYLAVGHQLPQSACNGNSRIDMTGRASACKHKSHI